MMKLQLKSIKISKSKSRESLNYQASLYVDGKPFAIMSNKGCGGCDLQEQDLRCKNYAEVNEKLKDYIANGSIESLEDWCCTELNKSLASKDLKKMLKKVVVLDGEQLFTYSCPNTKENHTRLENKGLVVLNTIDFDDALEIFVKQIY